VGTITVAYHMAHDLFTRTLVPMWTVLEVKCVQYGRRSHIWRVVSGRTNNLAPYCHHQIFILILTL
jgi:hypothetical protein